MTTHHSDLALGRHIFGRDAAGYAQGRLAYPTALYELLTSHCGLIAGARVFEIGPGTGQATQDLLKRGATVTAIEPDATLAMTLAELPDAQSGRLRVRNEAFEDCALAEHDFDLGVAATSFGWVNPAVALPKIIRALKPHGWWAMWWNVFHDESGDPTFDAMMAGVRAAQPDAFKGLTRHYALASDTWIRALRDAGFADVSYRAIERSIQFTPQSLRALYATFSPLRALSDQQRDATLDIEHMAREEASAGVLHRTFPTPTYLARRPSI